MPKVIKKHTPHNYKDLTGKIMGNFEVIRRDGYTSNGGVRWLCKCLSCGKFIYKDTYSLTHKTTQSCGCLTNEIISQKNRTHGLTHTRIHNIWNKIRRRCNDIRDKLYCYYGERGIAVCEEWVKDFKNFYDWAMAHGYNDSLTLDRIDVNGNYCPENCRWVNMKVQGNNRRNNINITYQGKTQTLKQWCEELNLDYKLTHRRIRYDGWSVEKAFLYKPPSPELFNYKGKIQTLKQ